MVNYIDRCHETWVNDGKLVGGLEHFLIFHILGIILPTDFHIFQRGRSTTNQIINGIPRIASYQATNDGWRWDDGQAVNEDCICANSSHLRELVRSSGCGCGIGFLTI